MATPEVVTVINEIITEHRQRQDMLRAELRLNNQIKALYRRATGLKAEERARLKAKYRRGKGQTIADTRPSAAQPDENSEGGHVAPLAQPFASDGEAIRVVYTLPATANPEDDTASGGDLRSVDTLPSAVPADLATLLEREAIAYAASLPLATACDVIARARKLPERSMERLAMQLPIWPWWQAVRGVGALGLAQIVGECGDLDNYANPGKVWKRMGLAVINGERQQKRTDADAALEHGYSPQRRSIMFVIADSPMKGNRDGEYRSYYLSEKERQLAKLEAEGVTKAPKQHANFRALRHMSKRLLRDLWRAWRVASGEEPGDGYQLAAD